MNREIVTHRSGLTIYRSLVMRDHVM